MSKIKGLLVTALLCAAPARAADVADWALPDAELALVFRGADRLPAKLREIDARYGTTRTLAGVVARLQAWEVAGMHPLAGDFGAGLDPAKGVALFMTKVPTERFRFVVGIKDEAAAREALLKLAQAAELPVEATPEGFKVQGKRAPPDPLAEELAPTPPPDPKLLKCAKREHFLVCDTEEPAASAPGRPAQLDPDARLELFVQGGVTDATQTPLKTLSVRWRDAANGGRMEVRAQVQPEAALALAQWIPGDTPVAGLDCIDARSGGVAKLSVDGPRMIQAARTLGIPPELAPLAAAFEKHWSGDLVASFAGSLMHPVVAVGVRPGGDGRALVQALAQQLTTAEVPVAVSGDALEITLPAMDESGEATRIRVPFGVTKQSLVLAIAARDVERCVEGTLKPLTLPAALAPKGRSGVLIHGPIGSVGALPGVIQGPPAWRTVEDLVTFAGVAARLIDQIGMAMEVSAEGVAIDLWWEVL